MENQSGEKGNSPKKMSKVWAIVIVVIIVVAAAAIAIIVSMPSKPSTTSTTPVAPSKVTITVWGAGSAGGEEEAFNESLAAFEKAYPNITVEDNPAINVASTQFVTAAHSGTAPNVYRDTSDNGAVLFVAGLILNLSKYLNQSYINQFTPTTIQDWTYNGSLYGIPVNTNGIALYYNKALLPNGTPPSNLYQMIQDAERVTAMGNGYLGFPYAIGADYGYRWAAWPPAFGGYIFNYSTGYPLLNSTPCIQAMEFVWNWTTVYHINVAGLTSITDEQAYFEAGKSAFMLDGPWDQSVYLKALGSNLGVTAIPFNNATGLWPEPLWGSVGYVISTPQASGANASQIWASIKFVEFMTNYNAQLELYQLAGDLPSLKSVASYITNNTGGNPLIAGWIDQMQHSQKFPNIIQMNYYWNAFHTGATNLEQNSSKVTVPEVMNQIESLIIQSLKANNIAPFVSGSIMTAYIPISSYNLYYQIFGTEIYHFPINILNNEQSIFQINGINKN